MEILVAILVIALLGAIAYVIVLQRNKPGAIRRPRGAARDSPLPPRSRASARHDPMAAAVEEHAQATDPQEAAAAEQRLRAQAQNVAAGMQAQASGHAAPAYDTGAQPGYGERAHDEPTTYGNGQTAAPVTGAAPPSPRVDDELERPSDESLPPDYDDKRYDGRRAEDWQRYQDARERGDLP